MARTASKAAAVFVFFCPSRPKIDSNLLNNPPIYDSLKLKQKYEPIDTVKPPKPSVKSSVKELKQVKANSAEVG
jgi:hypothetical protein